MPPARDAWFPPDEPDAGAAGESGDTARPFTVREVGERIQALLAAGFPGAFWMVGETLQLERAFHRAGFDGHWYFDLVDGEVQGPDRPSLAVKMWKSKVRELFGRGGRLHGRIEPGDGVVLKVLVRPDFYLPRGQLSFTIQDVDPAFTEGSLDRARRELLERLTAEGALERNGRLPLPAVPLRVGLVTSRGSAAHHDVLETLRASGLGLSVVFCDARTQGAATGPSVCAALAALARAEVELILLVRGGGSRLDLSGFDREDVARAVADCPVPVLTGIGHEIDASVADAVAHSSFKTPTAAAEFLVRCGQEGAAAVERTYAALLTLGEQGLAEGGRNLLDQARLLRHAAQGAVEVAATGLLERGHRLRVRGSEALGLARERVAVATSRLRAGGYGARVEQQAERLSFAARSLTRLERILVRRDAELDAQGRLVALHGARRVHDEQAALVRAEEALRLLDPEQVLARGYAWLLRADGTTLKDAAAARPGEALTARLRDGSLDLSVQDASEGGTP